MRTLAAKRERWAFDPAGPSDPEALVASALNEWFRGEQDLLPASRISPASPTTTNEGSITEGDQAVPTEQQFEGTLTLFRLFDEDGQPETHELWELVKDFGARFWVATSRGVPHTEDFATGQEYSLYRCISHGAQEPTDRGGYIKNVVPLTVETGWEYRTVLANGG